jgi:hypothetical protein
MGEGMPDIIVIPYLTTPQIVFLRPRGGDIVLSLGTLTLLTFSRPLFVPSFIYEITIVFLRSFESAHTSRPSRSHPVYILGNIFAAVGAGDAVLVVLSHSTAPYRVRSGI